MACNLNTLKISFTYCYRYNEDVTNGLTLAPPSPTNEASSGTVQDVFPSSSSSWFHDQCVLWAVTVQKLQLIRRYKLIGLLHYHLMYTGGVPYRLWLLCR